jgi:hypothetical protein
MTVHAASRDASAYTPATSQQARIAEAIGCILAGRAYPAPLGASAARADDGPPSGCEEGIGRILAGPAPRSVS